MLPIMWVAAFYIPLCAAFSFNLYGSTSDKEEVFLHPRSPREVDPEIRRNKRQAYQVYFGGDSVLTVDQTGKAETGPWGPWYEERQCSRTCGGGVRIEKRQCKGNCTGPSVRYVSCNVEDCPSGSKDFRAEQCWLKNDSPLDGKYYKWIPFQGKNKCELTCKPENANFYYKWADKVIDGTKCDKRSDDICVDGICLPLGCDKKLGSVLKTDKCGVCGGDGSNCKTVEGSFDERNLSPGYHNIIRLPVGSTSITVEEMRHTTNSLAIKNASDHFYLNGNYQIQVIDKPLEIGGTIFEYDNQKHLGRSFEKLVAKGPTKEELIIALLFQRGNRDSAIRYEFSVPLEADIPYFYKPTEWSACSVTCGKGTQTRKPVCVESKSEMLVDEKLCDEINATLPETERSCETVDCKSEWYAGNWEECSATCGKTGTQYRTVYCHQVFSDGKRMTVNEENCTDERPPVQQACNRFACPEWQAGPWSACSEKCGDALQYRSVTCRSEKEGEEGKLLAAEACGDTDLDSERSCNLGPCEGLKFRTTDWKLCERCNDTEETRNVTCEDKTGRAYPLEKCLNKNETSIPTDKRSCATPAPCIYEWHASQWSKCSTECGHGHQKRKVVCAIYELGGITIVDDFHCDPAAKPEARKNCTNEEKCTGTYFTSVWSECSKKCDGGKQTRMVICLNYDKKYVPELCDENEKPGDEQECNVEPCPSCIDSEFGCCPDNTTFAQGLYFEGCTNCSVSEFGCCPDNLTDASGPNYKGCGEYEIKSEEGSGEDEKESKEGEAKEDRKVADEAAKTENEEKECEVVSAETGEKVKVNCSLVNTTMDEDDVFGNVTVANMTEHCSKSAFGCCPDWITPAEGKDNKGCPEFVLGTCNETANGCCPDNVTMARGPHLEGCGDPACAASLYGCCKDRKTIAFGPHYAGCERSSFPCEISTYGCCPDGETAALGDNQKGCSASCLVSKFGCCPDGITIAKGVNNEGCGCAFAQYGCCPDGKTPAKGQSFFGCPESCARSQYGCCPDGKTQALGENNEGCPCQYTKFGCCPDGETAAFGPESAGCDECRYAKYGCCPDGETRASGPSFAGCPTTTATPYIFGGTVAPGKISACALPQEQGRPCAPGYKLLWFFDSLEGQCSQFWYGGCDGNDNRFASKEQCEKTCVEPPHKGRCYLPKVEGPMSCTALSARYWYDHTTRQCGAFWWRGCKGNANNFESWEKCQEYCAGIGPVFGAASPIPITDYQSEEKSEAPSEIPRYQPEKRPVEPQQPTVMTRPYKTMDDICRMHADSGPCQNFELFYYYDASAGQCYQFNYGGCLGNQNRYKTREECERRCGHLAADKYVYGYRTLPYAERPATPTPVYVPNVPVTRQRPTPVQITEAPVDTSVHYVKTRDACNERMDVGTCRGSFESYYYDKTSGRCLPFRYSGCGGTANRFHTKEQCEDLCLRSFPRYTNVGQMGSGRRLKPLQTIEAQQIYETSPSPISPCELPKDSGRCDNYDTKWYYNKADGTCFRFHYGGCEGNANRFDTEHDCKKACGNYADACTLPKVVGPCSGKHERYYYDANKRACQPFEFGGCVGNSNNFMTLEECERRCVIPSNQKLQSLRLADGSKPWVCSLPKDVGNCSASFVQYYYDEDFGHCVEFIYGGCDGNHNRFNTVDECNQTCQVAYRDSSVYENKNEGIPNEDETNDIDSEENTDRYFSAGVESSSDKNGETKATAVERSYKTLSDNLEPVDRIINNEQGGSRLPDLCYLPEEVGSCYGEILRWRFDSEKLSCVSFMYTGCKHNANFFTSIEACERACGAYRNEDVCSMAVIAGHCDNGITKWHYNPEAKQCQVFMYSGCGGNGNRFSSKAECEHLCVAEIQTSESDICKMKRDSGPCTDPVTQWYFDFSDKECKQFTYGGCRGNGNRFDTKLQCQEACIGRSEVSQAQNLVVFNPHVVCTMPYESSCGGSIEKWFFDISVGYCRLVYYGGCGGNQNLFESEEDCMKACSVLTAKPHQEVRSTVEIQSRNPIFVGKTIYLLCKAHGQKPIRWYKDDVELADTLVSSRIQVADEGEKLVISNTKETDSGSYACSSGLGGDLSQSVDVIVKMPKELKNCIDKGTETTCSLVVKVDLCGIPRYGNYCCRSCAAMRSQSFA